MGCGTGSVAVMELGMNHSGEIGRSSASPSRRFGVDNVGEAHIGPGSAEAIADARRGYSASVGRR
jgi:UDP-N-acetylmuramyl pentapeptide synthase